MEGNPRGGIPLPEGRFELLVNGREVPYSAERVEGRGPSGEDGTRRDPDGLYEVRVRVGDLRKGDVVSGRLLGIKLEVDGGGERMANMTGTQGGFTYGLGAVDLNWEPPGWRWLDTQPVDGGFEVRLAENPGENPRFRADHEILFIVAWAAGEGGEAYDVVSFCTC